MNVRMVESVADQLRAWSDASTPIETGGILVGLLADDGPWVTHAFQIETAERSSVRFELPAGVTQDLVRSARTVDPRLGYVGDWHSHPADVGPSSTDMRSLSGLARGARRFGDRPPVMIVVRRRKDEWAFDARHVRRSLLALRRTTIVLTGPPAPA